MKTGVLLLNLGTPDAPTPKAVRAYLQEFLMDPYVVDLPWLVRFFLVYGIILPFRAPRSSHAYQQIWRREGSPLLYFSQQFCAALQSVLSAEYQIELAMRYGQPSIRAAREKFAAQNCQRIIVFPLFPQFSAAASGSAIAAAQRELASNFQLEIYQSFYQDPRYQQVMAENVRRSLNQFNPDYVLFSYHGLPERQLAKFACFKSNCDRINCCPLQQKQCYRAQCFATTHFIIQQHDLPASHYQTVFQSRLGRAKWIQPYADRVLTTLIAQGVKRLMVVCPSFVVDCLETLEEIAIRLRAQWLSLGGTAFHVSNCLNAEMSWVQAVASMVRDVDKFAQH